MIHSSAAAAEADGFSEDEFSEDENDDHFPKPAKGLVAILVAVAVAAATCIWTPPLRDRATLDYVGAAVVPTTILLATRAISFLFFAQRACVGISRRTLTLPLTYTRGSAFRNRTVYLSGGDRLSTFTMLTWLLQTVYFLLATTATALRLTEKSVFFPFELVHIVFEVTWASSHLVTTVTTYVLVPSALQRQTGDIPLLQPDQLIMHNANVLAANIDACLSKMRLVPHHAGAAALWCVSYVIFTFAWGSSRGWVPYFFLDYTLPLRHVLANYLGLLFVALAFFFFGVGLAAVLADKPFSVVAAAHAALVAAIVTTKRTPPKPAPKID
ncbi:hypothetical protein CTAYLR_005985 [Chrysophaeum taylorii]|uniref:Uncharacterized protein n=1 Tax=Chrysophaeum taylorii TaxID=2483200 RepID=A0AAD7U5R8_9STRA|nr:hypothetical protein CTAYLR_005985 [Chrysophaeum taylorii]